MKQPDNTITPETKTLTPEQLREVLDAWCVAQPGVLTNINHSYGAGLHFPQKNFDKSSPQVLHVFDHEVGLAEPSAFTVLSCLAIQHHYIPWLQLAATLPYTGAVAARVALGAFRKPTEQEEERRAQAEVLFWNDED